MAFNEHVSASFCTFSHCLYNVPVSFPSHTTYCGNPGPIITAAPAVAGVALDPWCPALGATILDAALAAVDSNQVFSLPVHSLDLFGSQVTRGPGSDWSVALHSPQLVNSSSSSSSTNIGGSGSGAPSVQLLSAARGRLAAGEVVLEGLSIAAPPGSRLALSLTARPATVGSQHQVGLHKEGVGLLLPFYVSCCTMVKVPANDFLQLYVLNSHVSCVLGVLFQLFAASRHTSFQPCKHPVKQQSKVWHAQALPLHLLSFAPCSA